MKSSLTPEQEKHLANIKTAFSSLTDPKYRHGAAEHGGNLFDRSPLFLIEQSIMENIDQFTYLLTARDIMLSIPECHVGVPEPNPAQPLLFTADDYQAGVTAMKGGAGDFGPIICPKRNGHASDCECCRENL